MIIVCIGTVISSYVGSCVNIALPNIMAALNFNMDSVVWVSLGYMLPYGSMLPFTGKLGDKFGAKNMYIIGLVVFTIATILCGTASNSTLMVVFRIIQGIGGSMLLPNAMIIIVANFSGNKRATALGLFSAMAAAGSALGPTVGGYLIDIFNWRAVFFSVTPFCLAGIISAIFFVPKSSCLPKIKIDILDGLLMITTISTFLIALNQGEKDGWLHSYYIVLLFSISVTTFIMFVLFELHIANPIVDISLFKNLSFTLANILSAITMFTLFAQMFLLPFFLKSILNYSSIQAGVLMLSQSIAMVISAPIGGRLSAKIGARIPVFIGIMMITCAFSLLKNIDANFSGFNFSIPLLLYGLGAGFTMSPLTSCAISTLPKDKIGVGSGIYNFSRMISGGIGVVVAQILLSQRETFHSATLKPYLTSASDKNTIFQLVAKLDTHNLFLCPIDPSEAAHLWTKGMNILPEQYDQFIKVLSNILSTQVAVASFQDCFFVMMLLCMACAVLSLCLQETKQLKHIGKEKMEHN